MLEQVHEIYSIPGFSEPVSCWTHLLGAGVFLVLSFFLIRRAGKSVGRRIALGIFAFSCIFLLSISGIYHLLPIGGIAREVLQRIDHAAIFVFIAATITAVHTILFSGVWRWGMIVVAWIISILGVVLKTIFFTSTPVLLGLSAYLVFGWLGMLSASRLYKQYGFAFLRPLLYGGLAYTFGALIEYAHWPIVIKGIIGPHELFHLAVLLGISYHWSFVNYALGCGASGAATGPGPTL